MFLQDDYNFSVDENLELYRIEWLCFRLMQRILWCSFVFSNLIKWLAIYKLNLW